jgi:hypothetical protein
MNRAQYLALVIIGGIAVAAFIQSNRLANIIRSDFYSPPKELTA